MPQTRLPTRYAPRPGAGPVAPAIRATAAVVATPAAVAATGAPATSSPYGTAPTTNAPQGAGGTTVETRTSSLGRLLTDEEYRLNFSSDPIRALTTLRDQGVELTSAEIDALIRTDRMLWSDAAARIDKDLQRSSLLAD